MTAARYHFPAVKRWLPLRQAAFRSIGILVFFLALVGGSVPTFAAAIRAGFNATTISTFGNDGDQTTTGEDGSIPNVPLGFSARFCNPNDPAFTQVNVNINGNVTLNAPFHTFTPEQTLLDTQQRIIAPFWADVDPRPAASGKVKYGPGSVNGRTAFGVTWINIGYFTWGAAGGTDKLNSFQVILINRSDTGPGNFDIEFNYDKVQWEAGEASDGDLGLGGHAARVGYADGLCGNFEFVGSGTAGTFLDSNPTTGLIYNSYNSTLPGRYVFQIRNGLCPTPLQARQYLSLALDSRDNVWVSGWGQQQKVLLYDSIGQAIEPPMLEASFDTPDAGGHGALVDRLGQIWTAKRDTGLIRFNDDPANRNLQTYHSTDAATPPPFGFGDHNVGLDPVSGDMWTARNGDPVVRFAVASLPTARPYKFQFPQGGGSAFTDTVGLAVDDRGNVWLANPDGLNRVTHLRTDGALVGWVDLPCTQSPKVAGPRGIGIDANGKIWVPDFTASKVFRIDPDMGPVVIEQGTSPETKRGSRLGAVDMTVDLGAGASPDAYADLGGLVSAVARPESGTWDVVHDAGASRNWQQIRWTQILRASTELKVQVRAAAAEISLPAQPFVTLSEATTAEATATVVKNLAPLAGRFLEIRVAMNRLPGAVAGATPILKDLSITDTATLPPLPPDNRIPLAQPDFVTTTRNSPEQILYVLQNDLLYQKNPDAAHIATVSPALSGTPRISDDLKAIRYTPRAGFYGTDRFTYTVEDDLGATETAIVEVQVIQLDLTAALPPPVAADDVYPLPAAPLIRGNSEGNILDVIANDCFSATDTDCATSRAQIKLVEVTQPQHGTARIINCNQVSYTPAPYFVGTDTFKYLISNGSAEPREATVTVTVTGSAPITVGCGSSVNGGLDTGDTASPDRPGFFCDTYYLNGAAGKSVTLRVNSPNFYPYLRLRSPGGAILSQAAGNPGANTDVLALPRDAGSYILEVSSADGHIPLVGQYSLSVICLSMWVKFVRSDGSTVGLNSGDVLDFGVSPLNSPPPPVHLIVGNDGTSALNISSLGTDTAFRVSLSGTDANPGTGPLSFSIPAQSTKDVYLYFKPTTVGDFNNGHFSFLPSFNLSLRGHANPTPPLTTLTVNLVSPAVGRSALPLNEVTLIAPSSISILAEVTAMNTSPDRVEFFAWRTDESIPTVPFQTLTTSPYSLQWRGPGGAGIVDGDYVIAAVVRNDALGLANVSQCLVRVRSDPIPNRPPTAMNDTLIVMGDSANSVLDVLANDSDPDGDFVVVTQFQLPANGSMAYDASQRRFTYTPRAGFSGDDGFDYTISDQHGGTDSAVVTIHVVNSSINITSPLNGDGIQLPLTGNALPITATASAFGGATVVRVRFFVDNQMIGQSTSPSSGNIYSFSWSGPTPGDHFLTAAMVDSEGRQRYSQPVRITVFDVSPPTVAITSPTAGPINLPQPGGILLTAQAADFSQGPVAKVKFYVDGGLIGEDTTAAAGNTYSVAWTFLKAGTHYLNAVAVDTQGRTRRSATVAVVLQPPPGNTPPVAVITSPAESTDPTATGELGIPVVPRIQGDRLNVRGIAKDTDPGQTVTYQLVVSDVDGNVVAQNPPVAGVNITTASDLGTVSLTGLRNGRYNMNLLVTDQSIAVSATVCFLYDSEAKIGHLSFSQQDMVVPVSGIPLTVVRSYNSRNPKSADFGYSWTYSVLDLDIELDETRGDFYDAEGADRESFSMRTGGGRNVTLTLPDGRRTTFVFAPRKAGLGYYAEWKAPPGVSAKLEGIGVQALTGPDITLPAHWGAGSFRTPFQSFDIPGFQLTLPDGTRYIIGREDLGDHFPEPAFEEEDFDIPSDIDAHIYGKPYLAEIIQPNGQRLVINRELIMQYGERGFVSIDHYSPPSTGHPNGEKTASIGFIRDDQGRIKEVRDPNAYDAAGNPIGLPTITYDYDPAGNLSQVLRLKDRTAAVPDYETIQFKYENPDHPHYITKVVDAYGTPVGVNSYDDQGRLERLTDAEGRIVKYVYDQPPTHPSATRRIEINEVPPGQSEASPNVTVHESDDRGNVVLTLATAHDANGNVQQFRMNRQFDARNNILQETVENPADSSTSLTTSYDDVYFTSTEQLQSRVTREPHAGLPELNSKVEYNQRGQLLKAIDCRNYVASGSPNFRLEYEYADLNANMPSKLMEIHARRQTPTPLDIRLLHNNYIQTGPLVGLIDYKLDALNNKTVYEYFPANTPGQGRLGDLKTVINYDAAGTELSRVSYTYDTSGNRKTETRVRTIPDGPDADTAPDLETLTTQYFYDTQGRVKQVVDPLQGSVFTYYNQNGQVDRTVDRYGHETRYTYNPVGRLIETSYPDGAIRRTATEYVNGKRRDIVEETHFPTEAAVGSRTTYDELNRVITREKLAHLVIDLVPSSGPPTTIFQSADVVSTRSFHYDFANRIDYVTDALGNRTDYAYDGNGRRSRVITRANGKETHTVLGFDANDNQTAFHLETRPVPTVGNPNPAFTVLPTTSYRYDDFDHRIETDFPDLSTEITRYDNLGRVVENEDQAHVVQHLNYDGLGRMIGVTSALNSPDQTLTGYGYDEVGNLIAITNANQMAKAPADRLVTRFEYDGLGRRTKQCLPSQPNGHVETWSYDPILPRITHTDLNQRSTVFDYDERGRLLSKTPVFDPFDPPDPSYPPEARVPVSYTYRGTGKRQTMSDASGLTTYSYDDSDRLWQTRSPHGTLTYTYDLNGNLQRILSSNPSGTDVTYHWDEVNRLKDVQADPAQPTALTQYTYDGSGNLETLTYPNGAMTTYHYNDLNRLTRLEVQNGATTLASFNYEPDPANGRKLSPSGQRLAASELITVSPTAVIRRELDYSYDDLYRLRRETVTVPAANTAAGIAAGTVTYDSTPGYGDTTGLDRVGNRRSRTSTLPGVSTITQQTYDDNDRTINIRYGPSDPILPVQYDDNGRTRSEFLPTPVNATTPVVSPSTSSPDVYDFEGRLIRRSDGTTTITMVYDGDGNRVKKSVGGISTFYLVDHRNPSSYAQVLEEFDSVSTTPPEESTRILTRVYTYGHELISQKRRNSSAWIVSYYGYDGGGSVRQLLAERDGSGNVAVTDTYTYDAFGILIASSGSTPNTYLYRGQQWDPHLGLYYNRARYLNPNSGRFWTMDPDAGVQSDPVSLHRYLYANANPVGFFDPSGNFSVTEVELSTALQMALSGVLNVGVNFAVKRGLLHQEYRLDEALWDFGTGVLMRGFGFAAEKFFAGKLGTTAIAKLVIAGGRHAVSAAISTGEAVAKKLSHVGEDPDALPKDNDVSLEQIGALFLVNFTASVVFDGFGEGVARYIKEQKDTYVDAFLANTLKSLEDLKKLIRHTKKAKRAALNPEVRFHEILLSATERIDRLVNGQWENVTHVIDKLVEVLRGTYEEAMEAAILDEEVVEDRIQEALE